MESPKCLVWGTRLVSPDSGTTEVVEKIFTKKVLDAELLNLWVVEHQTHNNPEYEYGAFPKNWHRKSLDNLHMATHGIVCLLEVEEPQNANNRSKCQVSIVCA
jgi:hypothetical protein